jgi:catechol 2,3-dioxygenase-like lactoylglutathione lyase family enzyme
MAESDPRPLVWVGHIHLPTTNVSASNAFMQQLGMRPLVERETFAVLELRAGTHLVLEQRDAVPAGRADFDLMVDDLEATHARLVAAGLGPSPIEPGNIHRSFTVRDPGGLEIRFNSSHASGEPV